jgi:cytochrome c biogenesis protein CcdA
MAAELTLIKILGLALVDAINPCAFAVMTMVLVAILIANPENKKKVLYGGLTFTIAVFIGYFLYGLIIIQLFKTLVEYISIIYPYLTKSLAVVAIGIGIFNIKDFIKYNPGGFATEMPLSYRPRVKQLLKKVTGPGGAFIAGILVTIFLLPCTIGPYIIAAGSLSLLNFLNTIPWLLFYNLIFIIPMIAITLIVYFGVSSTERLSDWKERKIKYIHLIAGILLIGLGISIFTGII